MWSCNCLNIVIEAEGNDFEKVNAESLKLTEEETRDLYFRQDIMKVKNFIRINKVHSGLIQTRNVGSWVITKCINCSVSTHALHKDRGASCVIIHHKLMKSENIARLRSSAVFSSIYNILVDYSVLDNQDRILDTYLPGVLEVPAKNLKQIMNDYLKKESLAVQERIKKYTEEQYEGLNELRDRAFKEHQALIRVLRAAAEFSTGGNSHVYMIAQRSPGSSETSESLTASSESSPPTYSNASSNDLPPAHQQRNNQNRVPGSLDAEGLFEFDPVDDIPRSASPMPTEIEETESEDCVKTEPIKIPRSKSANLNLAKSLPVQIPTFMTQGKTYGSADSDEFLPIDGNVDIAASIKALARSVHGDAIFGDLPRPRFSTQL